MTDSQKPVSYPGNDSAHNVSEKPAAREWWVFPIPKQGADNAFRQAPVNSLGEIHVIEHSAFLAEKTAREQLQESWENARQACLNAERRAEKAEAELISAKGYSETLKFKKNAAEKERDELREKLRAAEAEITWLQVFAHVTDESSAKAKLKVLVEQLQAAEARITELQESLRDCTKTIKSHETIIDSEKRQRERAEKENELLKQEVSALRSYVDGRIKYGEETGQDKHWAIDIKAEADAIAKQRQGEEKWEAERVVKIAEHVLNEMVYAPIATKPHTSWIGRAKMLKILRKLF